MGGAVDLSTIPTTVGVGTVPPLWLTAVGGCMIGITVLLVFAFAMYVKATVKHEDVPPEAAEPAPGDDDAPAQTTMSRVRGASVKIASKARLDTLRHVPIGVVVAFFYVVSTISFWVALYLASREGADQQHPPTTPASSPGHPTSPTTAAPHPSRSAVAAADNVVAMQQRLWAAEGGGASPTAGTTPALTQKFSRTLLDITDADIFVVNGVMLVFYVVMVTVAQFVIKFDKTQDSGIAKTEAFRMAVTIFCPTCLIFFLDLARALVYRCTPIRGHPICVDASSEWRLLVQPAVTIMQSLCAYQLWLRLASYNRSLGLAAGAVVALIFFGLTVCIFNARVISTSPVGIEAGFFYIAMLKAILTEIWVFQFLRVGVENLVHIMQHSQAASHDEDGHDDHHHQQPRHDDDDDSGDDEDRAGLVRIHPDDLQEHLETVVASFSAAEDDLSTDEATAAAQQPLLAAGGDGQPALGATGRGSSSFGASPSMARVNEVLQEAISASVSKAKERRGRRAPGAPGNASGSEYAPSLGAAGGSGGHFDYSTTYSPAEALEAVDGTAPKPQEVLPPTTHAKASKTRYSSGSAQFLGVVAYVLLIEFVGIVVYHATSPYPGVVDYSSNTVKGFSVFHVASSMFVLGFIVNRIQARVFKTVNATRFCSAMIMTAFTWVLVMSLSVLESEADLNHWPVVLVNLSRFVNIIIVFMMRPRHGRVGPRAWLIMSLAVFLWISLSVAVQLVSEKYTLVHSTAAVLRGVFTESLMFEILSLCLDRYYSAAEDERMRGFGEIERLLLLVEPSPIRRWIVCIAPAAYGMMGGATVLMNFGGAVAGDHDGDDIFWSPRIDDASVVAGRILLIVTTLLAALIVGWAARGRRRGDTGSFVSTGLFLIFSLICSFVPVVFTKPPTTEYLLCALLQPLGDACLIAGGIIVWTAQPGRSPNEAEKRRNRIWRYVGVAFQFAVMLLIAVLGVDAIRRTARINALEIFSLFRWIAFGFSQYEVFAYAVFSIDPPDVPPPQEQRRTTVKKGLFYVVGATLVFLPILGAVRRTYDGNKLVIDPSTNYVSFSLTTIEVVAYISCLVWYAIYVATDPLRAGGPGFIRELLGRRYAAHVGACGFFWLAYVGIGCYAHVFGMGKLDGTDAWGYLRLGADATRSLLMMLFFMHFIPHRMQQVRKRALASAGMYLMCLTRLITYGLEIVGNKEELRPNIITVLALTDIFLVLHSRAIGCAQYVTPNSSRRTPPAAAQASDHEQPLLVHVDDRSEQQPATTQSAPLAATAMANDERSEPAPTVVAAVAAQGDDQVAVEMHAVDSTGSAQTIVVPLREHSHTSSDPAAPALVAVTASPSADQLQETPPPPPPASGVLAAEKSSSSASDVPATTDRPSSSRSNSPVDRREASRSPPNATTTDPQPTGAQESQNVPVAVVDVAAVDDRDPPEAEPGVDHRHPIILEDNDDDGADPDLPPPVRVTQPQPPTDDAAV